MAYACLQKDVFMLWQKVCYFFFFMRSTAKYQNKLKPAYKVQNPVRINKS